MGETTRILLVDDHEVVRLGLKTLLARHPHLRVIDEAANASSAIEKSLRHRPDVVIMDLYLPDGSGTEAIRVITRKLPKTRVVVLTAFAEDELLFDAIAAGACGYLLKEIDGRRIIETIEGAARGESLLDPKVTEKVLRRVREIQGRKDDNPFGSLTWQEKRVLALIAEGKSNREVGAFLHLSEKTARSYASQILSKLGVRSRTQAALYAIRHRLDIRVPPLKRR